MKIVEAPILAYRGDLLDPLWTDEEPGKSGDKVASAYPLMSSLKYKHASPRCAT